MSNAEEISQSSDEHSWDVPKLRKCLSCRTPFESQWSGERICKRCKSTAAWKNAVGASTF